MGEVLILTLVWTLLTLLLPMARSCYHVNGQSLLPAHEAHAYLPGAGAYCPAGQLNLMAALTLPPAEVTVKTLQSRAEDFVSFELGTLVLFFLVYSVFACYTAGTAVSGGLVIPILVMGSCVGRMVGNVATTLWHTDVPSWLNSGTFALIGASAMFAGVSRLTVALAVIMVEISDSLDVLIPIMVAIFVAKWVADKLTHPLYHALLEVKCVPFLDETNQFSELALLEASLIMSTPVITLPLTPTAVEVNRVLRDTGHSAFPIVDGTGRAVGLILRSQIEVLLQSTGIPISTLQEWNTLQHQVTVAARSGPPTGATVDGCVDLSAVYDTSPFMVPSTFSLKLTYSLFRSMGLRHILVTDPRDGMLAGIITRKDLVMQNIANRAHLD